MVLIALALMMTILGPAPHRAKAPHRPALAVPTTAAPATTVAPITLAPDNTVATTVAPGPNAASVVSTTCVPDPFPTVPTGIDLASPNVAGLAYANAPGGQLVGGLPISSWGGPTVRPVVASQNGWLQVRLDHRPNASTGWVRQQDVTVTSTDYWIVISTCRRTLTLFQQGQPVFSAPVGVGMSATPTPLGPSFVDAIIATPGRERYVYGPTIVVTASHSNVYSDFGGGDGTVAIHGYPSAPWSTAGVASSHGCIRANPQTISAIATVPVGTPIDFVS